MFEEMGGLPDSKDDEEIFLVKAKLKKPKQKQIFLVDSFP